MNKEIMKSLIIIYCIYISLYISQSALPGEFMCVCVCEGGVLPFEPLQLRAQRTNKGSDKSFRDTYGDLHITFSKI